MELVISLANLVNFWHRHSDACWKRRFLHILHITSNTSQILQMQAYSHENEKVSWIFPQLVKNGSFSCIWAVLVYIKVTHHSKICLGMRSEYRSRISVAQISLKTQNPRAKVDQTCALDYKLLLWTPISPAQALKLWLSMFLFLLEPNLYVRTGNHVGLRHTVSAP